MHSRSEEPEPDFLAENIFVSSALAVGRDAHGEQLREISRDSLAASRARHSRLDGKSKSLDEPPFHGKALRTGSKWIWRRLTQAGSYGSRRLSLIKSPKDS